MKKLLFFVFIIFVFSFISAHPTDSNPSYDDWRMHGHDTGFTRFTNSNAPANISNTSVITKTFVGDADTAPIIVWDSLYYFSYSGDYSASYAFKLNASNISQVLLNSTNTYGIAYSPTYYKNNLFIRQDTYLYQVNASNLSHVIDSEYIADSTGWDHVPVIFSDSVWIGAGNYNSYVKRYNASNISRTIDSRYIYGRPYEYLPIVGNYAYPSDSSSVWQVNSSNLSQQIASASCLANNIAAGFSVANGFVYKACTVNSVNYLFQFNASNISQTIANYSQKGWNLASGNGFVYFSNGSTFYQLNGSNISQLMATFTFPVNSWYVMPAITRDYAFVSAGSVIYQLNASNVSKVIGSYTAGSTIGSPPVVSKGFLYFGSTDDKLYQLGIYNPLPALRIDYPQDEKIYVSINELNYSLMQNDTHVWDKCWYSNNSGTNNFSVQNAGENFIGLSLSGGSHHLTVYCNDSNGIVYSEYSSSFIDNDFPIFTGVSNKIINQTSTLSHQINATDNFGVSCFSVNNSNFSISCSGILTNATFLVVGNYSLNISVYDFVEHYNYSNLIVSVLDSVAPSLRIVYPTNNTNSSNNGLDINYSVSDVGTAVHSCWYSNDSFSVNYTLAGCANISEVLWSEGVHNLRLWANDSSGNRNMTTLRFTIDTISPVFNNLSTQSVTQGNSFSYQINSTDSTTSISCFYVNNSNFTISCSGFLQNNAYLSEGVYPLNITVFDLVNNSNSSLLIVNVTTRPIIGLQIISPSGNINATQNDTFSVSVNVSCYATNCGALNVSLDPILGTGLNYSMYNSSESGADSYSWEEIISNGIGTAIWNNTNLDEGSSSLALPFNFSFYNVNYSRMYVVVNGRVDLTSDYTGSYSIALPHSSLKSIAAANQDLMLYSSSGGKVFYANRTSPNRVIVQYNNISTYGASATRYTFQIILYSDGKIKIQYSNLSTAYSQDDNNGLNFNSSNHLLIGADSPDQYAGKAVTFYPFGYSVGGGKGGLIPMNSGTPFYTTTQNPYNLSLNNGESQIVTWTVNATGASNNTYEFFVYANKTSDMGIGNISSRWNVTITNTPSCNPSWQNTSWGNWQNQTICRANNTLLQNRSLIQYDSNCGGVNVSFWDYLETGCDFCTPSMVNSSWSDWINLSCVSNLINQSRSLIQYDSNSCGEVENQTFIQYRNDMDCSINLNIISPENTTYNNRTQLLNISSNGISVWYNWNGTNISYSNPLYISFAEGVNTLVAYSNNSLSALASFNRVFTTDSIAPAINLISPINQIYNTTRILLNVSSDAENIWYNWNGTNISYSSAGYLYFSNDTINLFVYANDSIGNLNFTNVTFFAYSDDDFDGIRNGEDFVNGSSSSINSSGVSNLNVSIGGNFSANTAEGEEPVVFYDSSEPLLSFSHNFSVQTLDLSKIKLIKSNNSIIVNLSGQLQSNYNKTIFIDDNNFISLCVKDAEVSSLSEISSSCTGLNETDMTSCLGASSTINGLVCTDLGSNIRIDNLRFSAVLGVPQSSASDEVPAQIVQHSYGGGDYLFEINNIDLVLFRLGLQANKSLVSKLKEGKNTGIREIEIVSKNWITGLIYISNSSEKNCNLGLNRSQKIYKILNFNKTFNDSKLDSLRINMGISKDWIYSNNISDIRAKSCDGQELKISYNGEDNLDGVYDIYLDKLIGFAIFGEFSEGSEGVINGVSYNRHRYLLILWFSLIIFISLIVIWFFKHRFRIKEHFHSKLLSLDIRLRVGR